MTNGPNFLRIVKIMKSSFILTAIILITAVFIAIWQREKNGKLEGEYEALSSQVAQLGVDADSLAASKGGLTQMKLGQMMVKVNAEEFSAAQEAGTRTLAGEMVTIFKESKSGAQGQGADNPELTRRSFSTMEELLGLEDRYFSLLVAEFRKNRSLTPEERSELVRSAVMILNQQNPAKALSLILESGDLLKKNHITSGTAALCLSALAEKDPKAGLEWIDAHKDNEHLSAFGRQRTFTMVARKKPELLLERLMKMEWNGDNVPDSLNEMATALRTGANPDTVLKALRRIKPVGDEPGTKTRGGAVRDWILTGIGGQLVEGSFEQSKTWMESANLTGEEKGKVLAGMRVFLNNNPDPAPWLEWLRGLLPEEKMAEKMREIIPQWTRRDYSAVGAWLNGQPAGKAKDEAILSYAETLAPAEPEAAQRWLEVLPDSDKKLELLKTVREAIAQKPPEAEIDGQ